MADRSWKPKAVWTRRTATRVCPVSRGAANSTPRVPLSETSSAKVKRHDAFCPPRTLLPSMGIQPRGLPKGGRIPSCRNPNERWWNDPVPSQPRPLLGRGVALVDARPTSPDSSNALPTDRGGDPQWSQSQSPVCWILMAASGRRPSCRLPFAPDLRFDGNNTANIDAHASDCSSSTGSECAEAPHEPGFHVFRRPSGFVCRPVCQLMANVLNLSN